ncbi:MAG: serine/threonine protein kinase, partial [Planctomycetaceae bacterium]|nr:serine/threonine protein kinase [Planctomycetaceae bacterium]
MASTVKMKFTFAPESRPLDGYTIKRAIHRGGFGEVYYALSDSGREVALKLLQHNTDVELRGVQQCLNLSHPNLVTIFDVRRDNDGDHWILMEYVSGDTLDAVIRKNPNGLPLQQVLKWVKGIVAGTEYLHSRGIVHRDLKPGNVFSEGEQVKVGDIGLSKFITHSRRSAQTQSVGTVYYMAPEIAKGRYGKEVDVYALGVMVYEMLTGELPFDGESTGEILMKHLTEPPDLAKVPPALRSVLTKALEKDPTKRYSSMVSFGEAFAAAAVGKKIPESESVPEAELPKPKKVKEELPSWVSVGPSAPPQHPAKRPVPKQETSAGPPLSWKLSTSGWGAVVAFSVFTFIIAARVSSSGLVAGVVATSAGLAYVWMLILRTAPFPAVQQMAGPFFLTAAET